MWTTALIMTPSPCPNSQVPLFVLSRLLSSLWVSHTASASDWCALQEALYKCIDTIQYNLYTCPTFHSAHQSQALIVQETQAKESPLEGINRGTRVVILIGRSMSKEGVDRNPTQEC